jgi:hypothetical protein
MEEFDLELHRLDAEWAFQVFVLSFFLCLLSEYSYKSCTWMYMYVFISM